MEPKERTKRQVKEDIASCSEYTNTLSLSESEKKRTLATCLIQSASLSPQQRAEIHTSCNLLSQDPAAKQQCIGFKILNPDADARLLLHSSSLQKVATCEAGKHYAPTPDVAREFMSWCLAQIPITPQPLKFLSSPYSSMFSGVPDTDPTPQEKVDQLLSDFEFSKMTFLLECYKSCGRKKHHLEIVYIYERMIIKYGVLGFQQKAAHLTWKADFAWAKRHGLIVTFPHAGTHEKMTISDYGADVAEELVRRGITINSLAQMTEESLTREKDAIRLKLLLGDTHGAEQLQRQYGHTNQYFRTIVSETEEEIHALNAIFQTKSNIDLEKLNITIAGLLRQGVPTTEIAQRQNIPPIYVELVTLITNPEISLENIASLLRTSQKHIRYLRYLMRT